MLRDRIVTRFWSDSDVEERLRLHKDYIMERTLSKDLIYAGKIDEAKPLGEYSREWDLNGHLTVIRHKPQKED